MNNLFYLHPTKCGGTSVRQCLEDMDIKYRFISELQLIRSTLEYLKSDQRVIVFGHIGYLPSAETDEQRSIRSDISKILYFESDLIMPVRNPSNLLQSWMHYAKTRSNQILSRVAGNCDPSKLMPKDLGMLSKMASLKQDAVDIGFNKRGEINKFKLSSYTPFVDLAEEDEEHNLLKYIDTMKTLMNGSGINELNAMGFQLYAPFWRKIKAAILKGKAVSVAPPSSSITRKIIYYDCEKVELSHQDLLDRAIRPGFGTRLINTRRNVSLNKNKKKGCEFNSVNDTLQNLFPSEWQIYEKSKEILDL